MKKCIFLFSISLFCGKSVFAGPEISAGYGYMSYNLVDRGQSQYILKNNTYSGGFFRGQAQYVFALENAKLSLGTSISLPSFRNDVMTSNSGVAISFPWTRFGLEGKISVDWFPAVSPYARMALGYESWKVQGNGPGLSLEYGSFAGAYGEAGIGLDAKLFGPVRLFTEIGAVSGYQTGRFVDPVALSANKVLYYDTSTRTRGAYAIAGVTLYF